MVFLIVVAPSSPETLFRCRDLCLSFILASNNSVILAFLNVKFAFIRVPFLFFPNSIYFYYKFIYISESISKLMVINPRSCKPKENLCSFVKVFFFLPKKRFRVVIFCVWFVWP